MSNPTVAACTVRLTVDLPSQDVDALTATAENLGTNRTTALVKAVRMLAWLQERTEAGAHVEIVAPDGSRHQLLI